MGELLRILPDAEDLWDIAGAAVVGMLLTAAGYGIAVVLLAIALVMAS